MSIALSEAAKDRMVEQKVDQYFKEYRPHVEMLESRSLLSKVRSITPYDIYSLGQQFEAFKTYQKFTEEDGTAAQLGKIPDVAFDVITVVYGTSPIAAIASVQPIEEERGLIYYKSVIAQNTRGNVQAGDAIVKAYTPPTVQPIGYAGDVSSMQLATTSSGTLTYNATMGLLPIRPQSVKLAISGSGNFPNKDDGYGNILGAGVSGTINYQTGVVNLAFTSDPGAGRSVIVSYQQDFEAAADLPKIISKLDTKSVQATVFALKSTIGLEQSYALRRRFGLVAEDEVARDLVAAINSEIVNTLIVKLSASAVGNTNWVKSAPANFDYNAYKQSMFDAITAAESEMLLNAGRGGISVLIAGRIAASIMSTLPQFTRISDGNTYGPHIYGTLNGMTVVRVPDQTILDANTVLCLYNGTSPFDSAAVYAPYMPLVVTTALPNDVNPLLQQKAAAVWAAVDVIVPNFITKITFTTAAT